MPSLEMTGIMQHRKQKKTSTPTLTNEEKCLLAAAQAGHGLFQDQAADEPPTPQQ